MFKNLVINNKCENLTNEITVTLPYQFLGYTCFRLELLRLNVNEYTTCMKINKTTFKKEMTLFDTALLADNILFDTFQYKETILLPMTNMNICYLTSNIGNNNTLIKDLTHNIDNIYCNLISYGIIKNKSSVLSESDWFDYKDEKLVFSLYTDEWNKLPILDYFIIIRFQYDNDKE